MCATSGKAVLRVFGPPRLAPHQVFQKVHRIQIPQNKVLSVRCALLSAYFLFRHHIIHQIPPKVAKYVTRGSVSIPRPT